MVAVGFNPRIRTMPAGFVAERRLNRRHPASIWGPTPRQRFNRRSAPKSLDADNTRGLKPTATIVGRSATKTAILVQKPVHHLRRGGGVDGQSHSRIRGDLTKMDPLRFRGRTSTVLNPSFTAD